MTFDVQKAREIDESLYNEPDQDVGGNPCPIRNEIIKMFPAALDEIDRLRSLIERQAKRIANLDTSLDAAEALIRKNAEMINEQAKRIAELEGWLVEEVAARIAYENNMHMAECEPYAKCQARRQLISEGKISNSDHPGEPGKMVLTKEQREALDFAVRWLDDDPCDFLLSPIGKAHRWALRYLLSSPPAWEVTEERKAAISDALDILDGKSDCMRHFVPDVLRSMIEEARP